MLKTLSVATVIAIVLHVGVLARASASQCEAILNDSQETLSVKNVPLIATNLDALAIAVESDAVEMMGQLGRPNENTVKEIGAWLEKLRTHSQSSLGISFMEHTAVTFIISNRVFEKYPDPEIEIELEKILSDSWYQKTGLRLVAAQLVSPLPNWIVGKMSPVEERFHSKIFSSQQFYSRKNPDLFKKRILTASLLAFAFSQTGGEVVSGLIIGSFSASLIEHFGHNFKGHARIAFVGSKLPLAKWSREFLERILPESNFRSLSFDQLKFVDRVAG